MKYHKTVYDILSLLKAHSVWFETFEHEPVRTSYEASRVRSEHYTLKHGAKALILRIKKSSLDPYFVMIVLSGSDKFDGKIIKKLFSARDVRFASIEEVAHITQGIEPGGVPPFGNLFGLPVFVDSALLLNDTIIFNAGDRRFSIGMKSEDYVSLVKPTVQSIAQQTQEN